MVVVIVVIVVIVVVIMVVIVVVVIMVVIIVVAIGAIVVVIVVMAVAIVAAAVAWWRRSLAEGAVLALHGDAGEQVKGTERVSTRRLLRDVAGQSELLHKGLAFSEGACGHWRWSAQFKLAQGRAGAVGNTVLVAKVTLLKASRNAVAADSLAGRVVERGLDSNAVPACLDLAIGERATVAGDIVVVVAFLNVKDDAITADGAALSQVITIVCARPADLKVAGGVAAVTGHLVAVVAFPEVVVDAVTTNLDAVSVAEGSVDSVARPAIFNSACGRASTRGQRMSELTHHCQRGCCHRRPQG
jgi:hypothetical protein